MDAARTKSYIAEFSGQEIGGWPVLDYVGAGKSAVVFKSTDGTAPRILKVFDRELVERFGEEAQAERVRRELTLVGKSHPNLVKILGFATQLIASLRQAHSSVRDHNFTS